MTVNSIQQVPFVQETFGLLESQIIITGDKSTIRRDILDSTNSNGFDVVLTSGTNYLGELWRTIAPAGRLIQCGPSDLPQLDTGAFSRGASYSSIDIDVLYSRKSKLLSR